MADSIVAFFEKEEVNGPNQELKAAELIWNIKVQTSFCRRIDSIFAGKTVVLTGKLAQLYTK